MPLAIVIGLGVMLTGGGIYAGGEGLNQAGNATIKAALAAGALYIIYKKVA